MFSLLRIAVVIGVIFYLSPVRNEDGLSALTSWFGWSDTPKATPSVSAPDNAAHLETVWKALPETAKSAILAKILAETGIAGGAASKQPTDTLHAEDKKSAWKGDAHKPKL